MNFPCYEKGQAIAAATASAVVALAGSAARVAAAKDLLLWNPGPYPVHLIVGPAAGLVADATCVVIPAGALWAYGKGSGDSIATLAVGGAQAIVVYLGQGS